MRGRAVKTILAVCLIWTAGCAPRQISPVAVIDAEPLLEAVHLRQAALEEGIAGAVELSFRNGKKPFNGRIFIVALPDGRFRIEVPGTLGDTLLVLANDNNRILAYYPGENRASSSNVDGRAIDPHLPFPLPVHPSDLPSLVMGVFPGGARQTQAVAHLMDSGDRSLRTGFQGSGLTYTYYFSGEGVARLRRIIVEGNGMRAVIDTGNDIHHLPEHFVLKVDKSTMEGDWDPVSLFQGDPSATELALPGEVPVLDLENAP